EAVGLLVPGSAAWFRAGIQAINAAGKLGGFDRVEACADAALVAAPAPGAHGLQVSCLSWAALYLILGGRYTAADALLQKIGQTLSDPAHVDPQTAQLLEQSRAIRAVYTGDSAASLVSFEAALAAFEQTGDRRNACSIRVNLGFILAELGDFTGAEE